MAIAPVFHGHIDSAGKLQLQPAVRGLLSVYLGRLKDKPVEVVIRQHRQKRSSQASRYYFGVVVALIADHCGYERDEMHELLAMRFLRIEDDPVTGSPRRKHTPETDTAEFSEYVDRCIQFGAELDVYVPPAGTVDV